MRVDVVVITKNSEKMLKECLESVYSNVPVSRLIVVDGYSTDKTLEIVKEFQKKHGNVLLLYDRGNRATARQKGLSHVETTWFMFVDSDVVLCKNWFRKAEKHLAADVGAVWGIEVWSTIKSQKVLKLFLWITRKIFDLRGGTHDTLIRTEAVRDIEIPKNLHVFEDAYIMNWITRKGYRLVACYDPFCIHYRSENVWTLRGSLSIISDAVSVGKLTLLAKLTLAYGFYTAYSLYQLLTRKKNQLGI
ncbi:MAG: glycosyltransferase family 2 protein [Candidatus Bathyarchaeota archaeon]|nr:glycosyltransferase family 2 protein [Candidatus Bathyarchaeota archaeon]